MLESMTGYGRGEEISGNLRAFAEIRSVNYRYCEISLKLPSSLYTFEQSLKERIQNKIHRGKISVNVEVEHHTGDEPVPIQEEAVKKRLQALEKIRQTAGISDPVKLEHLLVFEELFETTEKDPELLEVQHDTVTKAVIKAVDELLEMRRSEGSHIQNDLEKRMMLLQKHCEDIRKNEKERIAEIRKKMTERLDKLLEDNRVDENRVEQEIALMVDRLDISEELVRMDSHIIYFRECLQSEASQGKKLNFILQEMHREVNTIGSKANNSSISRGVVEMKEIVENIREQVQNIA